LKPISKWSLIRYDTMGWAAVEADDLGSLISLLNPYTNNKQTPKEGQSRYGAGGWG